MTPFESKGLRGLGIAYFESIEALSIFVFFYGASFSLAISIWIIHEFDGRSFCYTFLYVGRHLRVRFLLLRVVAYS